MSIRWRASFSGIIRLIASISVWSAFEHCVTTYLQLLVSGQQTGPWRFFILLLSSADFFSKSTFYKKKSFRNNIRVSNGLDPDQDWHSVGPDLGPTCLLKLSADDKNHRARVTIQLVYDQSSKISNTSCLSKTAQPQQMLNWQAILWIPALKTNILFEISLEREKCSKF